MYTKGDQKKKLWKNIHIFQDKKYNENVNYNRIHMDTMLTPSKIGTKIWCIITCYVRGNVDEDADDGCKSDDDDEESSFPDASPSLSDDDEDDSTFSDADCASDDMMLIFSWNQSGLCVM